MYISFRNYLFTAEDGTTPVDSLQRLYGHLDNNREITFPTDYQRKILNLALSEFDIKDSAEWKKKEKSLKDESAKRTELELGLKRCE